MFSDMACVTICELLGRLLGSGFNIRAAVISAASVRGIGTTVHPGAGLVRVRAPNGPALSVSSVRGVTRLTRTGNTLLSISGAFTSPFGREPVRLNTSFAIRDLAGCVGNRNSTVKNTVVNGGRCLSVVHTRSRVGLNTAVDPFGT